MPMLHCHPHALRSSIFHTNHNTSYPHAPDGQHPLRHLHALMGTMAALIELTQLIQ